MKKIKVQFSKGKDQIHQMKRCAWCALIFCCWLPPKAPRPDPRSSPLNQTSQHPNQDLPPLQQEPKRKTARHNCLLDRQSQTPNLKLSGRGLLNLFLEFLAGRMKLHLHKSVLTQTYPCGLAVLIRSLRQLSHYVPKTQFTFTSVGSQVVLNPRLSTPTLLYSSHQSLVSSRFQSES